jgi:hypothetical protein
MRSLIDQGRSIGKNRRVTRRYSIAQSRANHHVGDQGWDQQRKEGDRESAVSMQQYSCDVKGRLLWRKLESERQPEPDSTRQMVVVSTSSSSSSSSQIDIDLTCLHRFGSRLEPVADMMTGVFQAASLLVQ